MSFRTAWIAWGVLTVIMAAYLVHRLRGTDRTPFLPGETTHGHYQIELACDVCHTPFQGVREDACLKCHAEELRAANDSHPKSKFSDPRNADLLKTINAASCLTCHREHVPHLTRAMGVTVPDDYCVHCHSTIATERPSHRGLSFDSCATAGCHNYHDNTALYEDFMARHLHDPDVLTKPHVPLRSGSSGAKSRTGQPLAAEQQDAPAGIAIPEEVIREWAATSHARAGVNCTDCHMVARRSGETPVWADRVDHNACAECHRHEVSGFLGGHHGMRLASGLPPMTPGEARQPMHPDSAHRELTCSSCHDAHQFDTRFAAVDACLQCHADTHSQNYSQSIHASLWRSELEGINPPGTGVSCATCHLPREANADTGVVRVQHNQNLNLRPNEKMLRAVCLSCHGLGFSIDSLADRSLVESNFSGKPGRHLPGLDWVADRRRDEVSKQQTTSQLKP